MTGSAGPVTGKNAPRRAGWRGNRQAVRSLAVPL